MESIEGGTALSNRNSGPFEASSWIRHGTVATGAAIVLVALIGVFFFRFSAGPGYPLDDSWIHLAFARHLAEGHGFGVNPGQASTGATSPLWALLLTAGFLFGPVHNTWPWILAAVVLGGAGLAAAWVTAELRARDAGVSAGLWGPCAAGLLVAASPAMVWSAAGAMEVPLFTALLLSAWAMHARARRRSPRLSTWGIPAGLAVLARPEGLLFAVLLGLTSRPQKAARNLIITAALCAPWPVYCLIVSGRPLPGTFYAKTTSAFVGLPDFAYAARSLHLVWQIAAPLCVLFLIGAIWKLGGMLSSGGQTAESGPGERTTWLTLLPGLLFPFALILSYSLMGRNYLFAILPGNYGRYVYPALPFLAIIGTWGLTSIRTGGMGGRGWGSRAGSAVLALLVIWNTVQCVGHADLYAHNVRDINSMQVGMATRLERRLPPESWVAANDVGALAYLTDLRVLDLVGIVSPEVQEALFPLRGMENPPREATLLRVISERQPAGIAVFPNWYPNILKTLGPRLEPIEEIYVPDNITSGGHRLVAYRVHWH